MSKKVLFINPSNVAYTLANGKIMPLGLGYLSAMLTKNGHYVSCLDLQVEDNKVLEDKIKDNDIIGISALTPNIEQAISIAKIAKRYDKLVILGGPHPSVFPEESLSSGFVDIVCRGEAENTIVEVVEGKESIENIKGISYVKNNKIFHNPDREYITNLDLIPFPKRKLFPIEKYKLYLHKGKKVMTMLTSRGCPNNCNFCYKGISGRIYRMRSVDNMLQEWEEILNLGADEIGIVDDSFTVNKKRVIEFCDRLIKEKMVIYWEGSSRVDTIDKEMLAKMKQAGYWRIAFGIESGSDRILELVDKKITKEKVKQAVKWAKEVGMKVTGFFMIGNYGENEQTMNETINFAKSLDLDFVQFTVAVPYPGTRLYDTVKKEGKFLFTKWSELGSYSGKAYFELGEVKKDLVEKMYKKAYRKSYLNFRMITKKMLEFRWDMLRFLRLLK